MLKKYFKKADFILLAALIFIGVASSAFFVLGREEGARVIIKSNGELYGTYPLYEDADIEVRYGEGSNLVIIKDGTVEIQKASCKNQVCVKHDSISKSGESIVCLPNRLIVTIEGGKGDDVDAISS